VLRGWKCGSSVVICCDDADRACLLFKSHQKFPWVCPHSSNNCLVFPHSAHVCCTFSYCLQHKLLIKIYSCPYKLFCCVKLVHLEISVWVYNDTSCSNCIQCMSLTAKCRVTAEDSGEPHLCGKQCGNDPAQAWHAAHMTSKDATTE
jgi:hypothetical protein